MATLQPASRPCKPHLFISYRRDNGPEEALASEIAVTAGQWADTFIDKRMRLGTPWARRIEEEIVRSDFFLVLLSEASVRSEMVIAEIELANRFRKSIGRPHILPVRVESMQSCGVA